MSKEKWTGVEEGKWSNKKREDKWFPNHSEDYLLETIVDSTSGESTSIFLEYNDKTKRIYRIKNIGRLSNKKIIIKIRNRKNNSSWTRIYVISPNEDGVDQSLIDINLTVKDFPLIIDEGKYEVDYETTIDIKVEDI
jgi:hypothetical protein